MFPRDTVYRRSVTSLQAEGFTKRALTRLLKRLIDTGFLSKEPGQAGVVTTYRLHLPAAGAAVTKSVRAPLPVRSVIEVAIAAYNAADPETGALPPEAARLLAVMFPRRDSVCQRMWQAWCWMGLTRRPSTGCCVPWSSPGSYPGSEGDAASATPTACTCRRGGSHEAVRQGVPQRQP
jgi:hypothetical protein